MAAARFVPVPGTRHAWRWAARDGTTVEVQVAAVASSATARGPFSIAWQDAERRTIEGMRGVAVPRLDDWVILKLIAAHRDRRRRARDLADVQSAVESADDGARERLAIPRLRARLRDRYGLPKEVLHDLVALFRGVPRPRRR